MTPRWSACRRGSTRPSRQGDEELQAEIEREMARQELREDYDEKKKAIQIEDARRQKALAIFQAIIDTASAIIKAMPNPYLMGLAGTIGGTPSWLQYRHSRCRALMSAP